MMNDHVVHFLDVLGLIDDPGFGLRNEPDANRIQLELGMMLTELQSLPAAVAIDYVAALIRSTDGDLVSLRRRISKNLRAIDVVQGVSPNGCEMHGDLLRSIKAQADRIERLLSRERPDGVSNGIVAALGAIDPTAYYDYSQVARILGVSESTIYRLKTEGRLQAVEIGRSVRFLGEHIISMQDGERTEVHVLQVTSS